MTRLALASHLFDIVLVLSQRPTGARLGEIATVLELVPSSVQSGLRTLQANGLVVRSEDPGPSYRLAAHPAIEALVAFAARRGDPGKATWVVLRANESVVFACHDVGGFVVAERQDDAATTASLDRLLGTISADRDDAPDVQRFEHIQFRRILRSALGLRARVSAASVVKLASALAAGPGSGLVTSLPPGAASRTGAG